MEYSSFRVVEGRRCTETDLHTIFFIVKDLLLDYNKRIGSLSLIGLQRFIYIIMRGKNNRYA